jgi:ribose/xylose/arabinose/galactoside ABC-type transport system permease subunit
MVGMGLLTLAKGLMLVSQGRPSGGLAQGELAFSAHGRGGFLELHPALALITLILVVAHLLLNRRVAYSNIRAAVSS